MASWISRAKTYTKKKYSQADKKLGGYYPFLSKDRKSLYYSSMGNFGFDVYKEDIIIKGNEVNLKEVEDKNKEHKNYNFFKSKKTNFFSQLIQPISWGLSDYGISEKGIDYLTLGLESKNLFSNLMFKGGYKFDVRDDKNKRFFGISYQGFFPILDLTISNSNDYFNQNLILTNNTGIIAFKTSRVIKIVINALDKIKVSKIVLDPVMVAKGGAQLIDDKAINVLKKN